jgi:hypothetical protein
MRARHYAEMCGFLIDEDSVRYEGIVKTYKPDQTLLNSAHNDFDLNDIEIPSTDIYSQELFLYCY